MLCSPGAIVKGRWGGNGLIRPLCQTTQIQATIIMHLSLVILSYRITQE